MPSSDVVPIHVFSDDEAPVGGIRVARELHSRPLPADVTDVVLDMTALSIGIGFPAARVLLEAREARPQVALQLMIASNPALHDRITAEPTDRPMSVHGFSGTAAAGTALEVATIWVPMLPHSRGEGLV